MRQVELLRAWENKTWDTEIVKVPDCEEDEENGVDFHAVGGPENEIIEWANKTLLVPGNSKYDGLAMFAVYWINPEEE